MITMMVGGTWGPGARQSKVFEHLVDGVLDSGVSGVIYNGGSLDELEDLYKQTPKYDAVIWMPFVDNDVPKWLPKIKQRAPHVQLVCSKRIIENTYDLPEVVARALTVRANLVVCLTRGPDGFSTSLIDPLGNVFVATSAFDVLGRAIGHRLQVLGDTTRVASESLGHPLHVPDKPHFFDLVRRHAEIFDALVPRPQGSTRFLGNASFRCTRGFPSFRSNDLVFVSQRNIDKTHVGRDAFVAIEAAPVGPVRYHGHHKPSVDAPIQRALYHRYPWAQYMLHGHVYVAGAPMTETIVPCGALEEAQEVIKVLGDTRGSVAVNLKGHGFLALMEDVSWADGLKYIPRPNPEFHVSL